MKKRTLVLCLVLGSLALLGTLLCLWLFSPKVTVKRALIHGVRDLTEREEISSALELLDGGSVAISAENRVGDRSPTDGISAGAKLYFDTDRLFVEDLHVTLTESELQANLYADGDRLYVESDILPGHTLGLIRGEALSSFEQSVFAYRASSRYALSHAEHDKLAALLRQYDAKPSKEVKEEGKAHLTRYLRHWIDAIEEYATYETQALTAEIGNESVRARAITLVADTNALRDILLTLRGEIAEYQKLRAFLEENADALSGTLSLLLTEEEQENPYEAILARLDDLANRVEEQFSGGLTVTLLTPSLSARLMKLTCQSGEAELFSLEAGTKGLRHTSRISVTLEGENTWCYTVDSHTREIYEATLLHKQAKKSGKVKETVAFSVRFDRAEESFKLTLDGEKNVWEGSYSDRGEVVELFATQVKLDGKAYKGLTLSLTFREEDDMPMPIPSEQVPSLRELTEADAQQIESNTAKFAKDARTVLILFLFGFS